MVGDPDESTAIGDRRQLLQSAEKGPERAYVVVIAGPGLGEMHKVADEAGIGRGNDVAIRILDDEISRRHARLIKHGNRIWIEDLGSTNGTFVNGATVSSQELRDGDKIQVGTTTILKFSYHDDLEEEFQRRMYESALRDGLTGAFNKKYLLERLDTEFAYSARHQTPLSLLIFDLDHFKYVNDTYGHLAGDSVLSTLARHVDASVRREDVFARYGGEEFALLTRGIDVEGARSFAERMREAVDRFSFEHDGTRLPVTISVGVASVPHPSIADPTTMIAAADHALYAAKDAGRNCVEVYRDDS